jgi:hypothetical protein
VCSTAPPTLPPRSLGPSQGRRPASKQSAARPTTVSQCRHPCCLAAVSYRDRRPIMQAPPPAPPGPPATWAPVAVRAGSSRTRLPPCARARTSSPPATAVPLRVGAPCSSTCRSPPQRAPSTTRGRRISTPSTQSRSSRSTPEWDSIGCTWAASPTPRLGSPPTRRRATRTSSRPRCHPSAPVRRQIVPAPSVPPSLSLSPLLPLSLAAAVEQRRFLTALHTPAAPVARRHTEVRLRHHLTA